MTCQCSYQLTSSYFTKKLCIGKLKLRRRFVVISLVFMRQPDLFNSYGCARATQKMFVDHHQNWWMNRSRNLSIRKHKTKPNILAQDLVKMYISKGKSLLIIRYECSGYYVNLNWMEGYYKLRWQMTAVHWIERRKSEWLFCGCVSVCVWCRHSFWRWMDWTEQTRSRKWDWWVSAFAQPK